MLNKHTVLVLHRMSPKAGCLAEALREAESFIDFLKKKPGFRNVEMICAVDSQIVWLEEWTSKKSVEEFNMEHLAMSDHLSGMANNCAVMPTRLILQKAL